METERDDDDGARTLLAFALGGVLGLILWAGLIGVGMWAAPLVAAVAAKVISAVMLLFGSWVVIRACSQLDR